MEHKGILTDGQIAEIETIMAQSFKNLDDNRIQKMQANNRRMLIMTTVIFISQSLVSSFGVGISIFNVIKAMDQSRDTLFVVSFFSAFTLGFVAYYFKYLKISWMAFKFSITISLFDRHINKLRPLFHEMEKLFEQMMVLKFEKSLPPTDPRIIEQDEKIKKTKLQIDSMIPKLIMYEKKILKYAK